MLDGVYPVMIDGELRGKLTVHTVGTAAVFDAECRFLPGIVRISVYGDGGEGYLGVLAPEGDGLGLHKKLSRTAMRDFPRKIEAADRAGQGGRRADTGPDEPTAEECAVPNPAEEPAVPAPAEAAVPEGTDGLYWYSSPDGALVCFDGERNLIALPPADPRNPGQGGVLRCVEGRDYLVYRTKNGRLIY